MGLYPSYRSMLVVDIEGSRGRDDRAKPAMRTALYEVLTTAFRDAGIDWEQCDHADRGDGALVLIPAAVEKVLIVDHLVGRLQTALYQHNSAATATARIRVRLALHAGEVTNDVEGWSGRDLDQVFALNTAPVLRRVLAESTHSDIAVIASRTIHDAVLRHGFGPPDLAFVHRVELDTGPAWIWVPGYRNPPGLAGSPTPADTPRAGSAADPVSGGSDGDPAESRREQTRAEEPAEPGSPDGDDGARSSNQRGGTTAGRISVGRDYIGRDRVDGVTPRTTA